MEFELKKWKKNEERKRTWMKWRKKNGLKNRIDLWPIEMWKVTKSHVRLNAWITVFLWNVFDWMVIDSPERKSGRVSTLVRPFISFLRLKRVKSERASDTQITNWLNSILRDLISSKFIPFPIEKHDDDVTERNPTESKSRTGMPMRKNELNEREI